MPRDKVCSGSNQYMISGLASNTPPKNEDPPLPGLNIMRLDRGVLLWSVLVSTDGLVDFLISSLVNNFFVSVFGRCGGSLSNPCKIVCLFAGPIFVYGVKRGINLHDDRRTRV